jgi:Phosphoglucomutase
MVMPGMSEATSKPVTPERGATPRVHPLAGKRAPSGVLIDPRELCTQYYVRQPDEADPPQRVSFGTSGHRGSAVRGSFNEAHVLAITQAICEFRKSQGIDGPLYVGKDSRIDAPATHEQKAALLKLSATDIQATSLAGDPIQAMLTSAPGNGALIGGLKVISAKGWFAARPSGTEDVYKLYAESFRSREHLERIQAEARALINDALAGRDA